MVEQVSQCYEHHEALSSQIRQLGQVEQQEAYAAACLEWEQPHSPNCVPVESHLRELFIEKCEAMIQSNPTTAKDQCLVSFACYAKLSCLSLQLDSHPQKDLIIGEAHQVAMQRIFNGQGPDTLEALAKQRNLIKKLLGQDDDDDDILAPEDLTEPGPFLVGKSFEYLDSQTGHSVTCLVHDCGTSHLIGDWFEISRASDSEMVTLTEMTEIWEARETDPE
ncbi:hypothetical protein OG21DRAFT_1509757 [Imleria badia]|nr:hypothetical protein OG21DRAFT_1509757 [Imleria badia]